MLQTQLIYCGDNLTKLRELPDESVDLCYIDPPFNSNRNYEVFWATRRKSGRLKTDSARPRIISPGWRPRVSEIYRVLKKTGSFYYHCDWHADGYVRVMLDEEFGPNNYRSHILWKRQTAHNDAKRRWGLSRQHFLLHEI